MLRQRGSERLPDLNVTHWRWNCVKEQLSIGVGWEFSTVVKWLLPGMKFWVQLPDQRRQKKCNGTW